MAPMNPGGRPKLDWTSSRKRKLGRLYLLTNLAIVDIQQILKDEKFNPSVRSIQAQLSLLLPNNVKEWRRYRPTDQAQMVNRLAQLKRARKNRISKYNSSQRSPFPKVVPNPKSIRIETYPCPQLPSPHYDPSRYYTEKQSTGPPQQFILSPHSPPDKIVISNDNDILNYSSSNSNYVVSSGEEWDCSSPSSAYTIGSPINSDRVLSQSPPTSSVSAMQRSEKGFTLRKSPPRSPPGQRSDKPNTKTVLNAQLQVLSHNKGQLRSITNLVNQRTIENIRKMPRSIHSKMSHCLSHIESVISTSNSWRSSLIDAMSLSSSFRSDENSARTPSCDVKLTMEEYRTWDELVDQSKFASTLQTHTEDDAISLISRPCCMFFENDEEKRTLCKVCGFSEAHALARNSWSDDGAIINCSALDRFGNTPLHHAAAAGNLKRVTQLMGLIQDIQVQNTSGETALHVLELEGVDSAELDEALHKAADLGFDFATKDYTGNEVVTRLQGVADFRWSEEYHQWIFAGGAGVEETYRQGEINLSSAAIPKRSSERKRMISDDLDSNGDTKLLARLRKWPKERLSQQDLSCLIKRSNVHMRARRGYTAIAVAVRHGIRDAISLLLEAGANPNNRSYRKTSVMGFAAACLAKAQKDKDSGLYARILSCIVLLADHGGKADPTVYDEFTIGSAIRKEDKPPAIKAFEISPEEMYRKPVVGPAEQHWPTHQNTCELEIRAALARRHFYGGDIQPKIQIISEIEPEILQPKKPRRLLARK